MLSSQAGLFFLLREYIYENNFIFYSALDKNFLLVLKIPLGNYFLWRALMPDTVMPLCQPFGSKAQQPNMHGDNDKLSESHVKTTLILLQHGLLIMDLTKQQAASRGKRWN